MPDTRAVERRILERNEAICQHCLKAIKFQSMTKLSQIIANVYKGRGQKRKWNRVEHFHRECYDLAEQPHGPIMDSNFKQFSQPQPR